MRRSGRCISVVRMRRAWLAARFVLRAPAAAGVRDRAA